MLGFGYVANDGFYIMGGQDHGVVLEASIETVNLSGRALLGVLAINLNGLKNQCNGCAGSSSDCDPGEFTKDECKVNRERDEAAIELRSLFYDPPVDPRDGATLDADSGTDTPLASASVTVSFFLNTDRNDEIKPVQQTNPPKLCDPKSKPAKKCPKGFICKQSETASNGSTKKTEGVCEPFVRQLGDRLYIRDLLKKKKPTPASTRPKPGAAAGTPPAKSGLLKYELLFHLGIAAAFKVSLSFANSPPGL